MMDSAYVSFHAQLGSLLESAQTLLAVESGQATGYYYDPRTKSHQTYYQQTTTYPTPGGGLATTTTTTSGKRPPVYGFINMQAELRTLEFWRSIIAECVVAFFYVIVICSVNTSSTSHTIQTNVALASGVTMAVLTSCFAVVSDCHVNPAITVARMLTRHISPLRMILYVCAQCGGGIAGAAVVYGVYSRIQDPVLDAAGKGFGMEYVLTFLVAYAFYASRSPSPFGGHTSAPIGSFSSGVRTDAIMVGLAYGGCLIAWKGSLNPARALASAFVSKDEGRFTKHWVLWLGPITGAITGAFAHEYIFSPRRRAAAAAASAAASNAAAAAAAASYTAAHQTALTGVATTAPSTMTTTMPYGSTTIGGDMNPHHQSSFHSDEDMIDDLERAKQYKVLQDYNTQVQTSADYSSSSIRPYKRNPPYPESMYSGTKSLYNQPINGNFDSKSVYGDIGGSKSCYNGYDGAPDTMSSLRRGPRPGQQPLRGAAAGANAGGRRNPYDYLPEEPSTTGLSNKPDIISSRKMTSVSNRNYSPTKYDDASRANDNYATDKMDPSTTNGFRSNKRDNELLYGSDANYNDPSTAAGVKRPPPPTASSGAVDNYGSRPEFQRMSRMRGGGGGGNDFYSPQYNATYSQQNGCSITPNSAVPYNY